MKASMITDKDSKWARRCARPRRELIRALKKQAHRRERRINNHALYLKGEEYTFVPSQLTSWDII